MATLRTQFALAPLLKPLYLIPRDRLPVISPHRRPAAFWVNSAAFLDERLEELRRPCAADCEEERRKAEAMLGEAGSFQAKASAFFENAASALEALEQRGLSQNVTAASIILYAWDWRIPEHDPALDVLQENQKEWDKRWKSVEDTANVLRQLVPVAARADLLAKEAMEASQAPFHDRPELLRELGLASVDERIAEYARRTGERRLEAAVAEMIPNLSALQQELQEALEVLRGRGPGCRPEEKVSTLVYFLAELDRQLAERVERWSKIPIEPRGDSCHPWASSSEEGPGIWPKATRTGSIYKHLAGLLNAADLPPFGAAYFNPSKVRQCVPQLRKSHPEFTDNIDRHVTWAFAAAEKLATDN